MTLLVKSTFVAYGQYLPSFGLLSSTQSGLSERPVAGSYAVGSDTIRFLSIVKSLSTP
jgi:hypothetical protein